MPKRVVNACEKQETRGRVVAQGRECTAVHELARTAFDHPMQSPTTEKGPSSSSRSSSRLRRKAKPRIRCVASVVVDSLGVSSFYSPSAAAALTLNLELGSGVLLLPAAFAHAGLGLGSCWCA